MLKVFRQWIDRYLSDEEAVIIVLLMVFVLVVLAALGEVLAPVIAALVLAFIMQGLAARMEKWGVPHAIALWITFVVFLGGMVWAMLVVLPRAWQQTVNLFRELPRIMETTEDALLLLPERYPTLFREETVEQLVTRIGEEVARMGQALLSFSLTNIPNLIALLVYVVLVPILIFFLLKDRQEISDWCSGLLPRKRPRMTAIWGEMNLQLANYVRGKFIEILIVGAVTYVVFTFLDVKYALLLAIAVGLSVLIPYIGAAVVTVPVAVVGYFQFGFGSDFFWLMIAYLIIQTLDGNVLVPLLFSEAVNLHPVAIILAVLVFGGLWGFWGVFFAIPLATLVKALINAWPRKPLGPEPAEEGPAAP